MLQFSFWLNIRHRRHHRCIHILTMLRAHGYFETPIHSPLKQVATCCFFNCIIDAMKFDLLSSWLSNWNNWKCVALSVGFTELIIQNSSILFVLLEFMKYIFAYGFDAKYGICYRNWMFINNWSFSLALFLYSAFWTENEGVNNTQENCKLSWNIKLIEFVGKASQILIEW